MHAENMCFTVDAGFLDILEFLRIYYCNSYRHPRIKRENTWWKFKLSEFLIALFFNPKHQANQLSVCLYVVCHTRAPC